MIKTFVADAIRVDSDERGYGLIIDTDEGDKLYVDIQSVVLDFYASVQKEIRPYVLEAEMARATMPDRTAAAYRRLGVKFDEAYAPEDPKNPSWQERMSDWADNQRKLNREGGA